MALVTVSKKRNRVYYRKFDHDEARRLRAEDPKHWSYSELARHFDVSKTAIRFLFFEKEREKATKKSLELARRKRKPCKGGCGRLVWNERKRTGYCRICVQILRIIEDVRAEELRCTTCRVWKPDEEFSQSRRRPSYARRGRRPECRACESKRRKEFRRRYPEREKETANRYYREVRAAKRRGSMSQYVVLQQNDDGSYRDLGTIEAGVGDLAIERLATEPGKYVAVPVTRFEILEVAPETRMSVQRKKG